MTPKEAENKILEYKILNNGIKAKYKQLERLKYSGSPRDITAVDLNAIHGGSCQRGAERTFKDITKIMNSINDAEYKKEELDLIFNIIEEENATDYKFIDLFYFKNNNIMEVATQLGYSWLSKQSIYKIKNRTLEKFAKLYQEFYEK